MIKYRFCYSKYGDAKYVSHLDLMRLFFRAFKRAEIPLTHSEGFNPHPKLAVGLPLSVGVTSECEYMDAEADRALTREDLEQLNKKLPTGIHINSFSPLTLGMKKLADIRWAGYRVTVCCTKISPEQLQAFLDLPEIVALKRTKRKTEPVNILPDIMALSIEGETDDGLILSMVLSAGSAANLKPELVLLAMEQYIDGLIVADYDIHRVSIFSATGKSLL